MIYISELLPNPAGKDTEGEWMEICAAGSEPQNLTGWKLQNAKGKEFLLPDQTLEPYECVAFDYVQTKLTLTNIGGAFYLINPAGETLDAALYEGTYKDDISAMRTNPTSEFVMSATPTKGRPNKHTVPETKTGKSGKDEYVASITDSAGEKTKEIVVKQNIYGDAILGGVLSAGVLTAVFWYIFKKLYAKSLQDM